jgi:hypothetical protein
MSQRLRLSPAAFGMVLLSGCGAAAQSLSTAPKRDLDCSFRSEATCWTVAPRFPTPRPERRDSTPEQLLQQPPAILAAAADTVSQ